jgi:hypothetical protein
MLLFISLDRISKLKTVFDKIYEMYWAADKIGIPLAGFPSYIVGASDDIRLLLLQRQQLRSEKQTALEDYHITETKLEKYWTNRPYFEENQEKHPFRRSSRIRSC